jgi:ParB-like chromosome segregation protein Spo0J
MIKTDTHIRDQQQPHDGRAGSESPANKARAGATPYSLHPVCADYADFTEAEAVAMRESLRKLGLLNSIVLWRGQIVDGRHRQMFCRELGIDLRYDDLTARCPTEEAMRSYVAALNEHRRSRTTPLTIEEKRAKVDAALKADPGRSDQAIAEETGTSVPFVGKRRKKLSKGGVNVNTPLTQRRSRKGKLGQGQHRPSPSPEPEPGQQPEPEASQPQAEPKQPTPESAPAADDFEQQQQRAGNEMIEQLWRVLHSDRITITYATVQRVLAALVERAADQQMQFADDPNAPGESEPEPKRRR